jgi:DNA-binding LacI/PurR family transcriptional regulator
VNSRLQDIARHTGLSESTVSRVLNRRKGVSSATRDAVLTAVDVLGYERPSALRDKGPRLIGVLFPQFGNPIFPAIAEVVGSQLTQRGFVPLFAVTENAGPPEASYVEALLDQQVAGMVFISGLHAVEGYDHAHYRLLLERGLPLVVINGVASDLPVPCVSTDDAESVRLAVRHLVDLGHRHIGLAISDVNHVPGARKMAAFKEEVSAVPGLRGDIEQSIYSLEGGSSAASRLIQSGVTGIICASDMMALGVIKLAMRLGIDVPGDLSVVGFDDSSMMSLIHPAMTTIRQPADGLGKAAASLLLAQIAGSNLTSTSEILYEPELVMRGSTGPAPAKSAGSAA